MQAVYIVGSHSTAFGKKPTESFKDLARETITGVLADAQLENGREIDFAYFGNCAMHGVKQGTIRGQALTVELFDERLLLPRMPMINVEGGCATGSMTIHSALKDIRSGASDLVLAFGVEKLFIPRAATDPAMKQKMMKGFMNGVDNFDVPRLLDEYRRAAAYAGVPFDPQTSHSVFMDTYAIQAAVHMKRFGTTQEQIAIAAAKNHNYGALNPLAQYRFEMTPDDVLNDRVVSFPLTRAMCAPIGDGAAAALICSEERLSRFPTSVQDRAVQIRASVLTGGYYRDIEAPSLSHVAAQRAYEQSGLGPDDVDVVELHDATSFSEIYQLEMLGFAPFGEAGKLVESGATGPGGALPVNTSGGLVSKGHPVGATGLSMAYELVTQLRGEAGERQVPGARIALQENGGGVIGLEEAACAVMLLEKAS